MLINLDLNRFLTISPLTTGKLAYESCKISQLTSLPQRLIHP